MQPTVNVVKAVVSATPQEDNEPVDEGRGQTCTFPSFYWHLGLELGWLREQITCARYASPMWINGVSDETFSLLSSFSSLDIHRLSSRHPTLFPSMVSRFKKYFPSILFHPAGFFTSWHVWTFDYLDGFRHIYFLLWHASMEGFC